MKCRVSYGWCFEHMCHAEECKKPYFIVDGHRAEVVEYDDIAKAFKVVYEGSYRIGFNNGV